MKKKVMLHGTACVFGMMLAAALLLYSCRPPVGDSVPPETECEAAGLEVRFIPSVPFPKDCGVSRTVVPASDLGIDSITVTVTHSGGESSATVGSAGESCEIADIAPGSVTVEAVARDAADTGIARGSAGLTLVEGEIRALTIALVPDGSGEGAYAFAMRWPSVTGAGYVEYHLEGDTPISASVDDESDPDEYLCICGEETVPAGAYNLFITFYDNSTDRTVLGAFVEAVNVYGELTSDTWLDGEGTHRSERVFTADEFKDSLTSLYRLTVTGSGFSRPYTAASVPPLEDGVVYALDRTASPALAFTAELTAPGAGQAVTYTWNGAAGPNPIGSGAISPELPLSDGVNGLNELVITVTASSGDTAVYTVTVVKAYRLSFDGNGSTGGDVPADALYYAGEPVTVAEHGNLVREGWSFIDWNTEPDGSGDTYLEGQEFDMDPVPLTLYARWIQNGTVGVGFSLPEYHSLLFVYDGEVVQMLTVPRDAAPLVISYGGAAGTGWTWYLDGALEAGATTGSYSFDRSANGRYAISCAVTRGDATFGDVRYAGNIVVTVVDPVRLSYDGNGADSGTPPEGADYTGEPLYAGEDGTLARSGFSFDGWNTAADGSGTSYAEGNPVEMSGGSVTLYAVWEDIAPPDVTGLAAETGDGSVTLSWTDPPIEDAADFESVEITYTGGSSGTVTVEGRRGAAQIVGLVNHESYTFTVTAYDTGGNPAGGMLVSAYPGGCTYTDFVFDPGTGTITAFSSATARDIVIPGSFAGVTVTAIGANTFQNRTNLLSVVIPNSVEELGDNAFSGCTGISIMKLPPNLQTISRGAFEDCSSLAFVTIPSTAASIGEAAFRNCTGLLSVSIPGSVSAVDDFAFSGCSGLQTLSIFPGVTAIGTGAFGGCGSLVKVNIPYSVETIGAEAFSGCLLLDEVHLRRGVPGDITACGADAFDNNAAGRSIYVPAAVETEYEGAAGWSEYTADIAGE